MILDNLLILLSNSKGINFVGGGTRTDKALKAANKELFSPSGGYSKDRTNVLIVITDGKANSDSEPYSTVLPYLLVSL